MKFKVGEEGRRGGREDGRVRRLCVGHRQLVRPGLRKVLWFGGPRVDAIRNRRSFGQDGNLKRRHLFRSYMDIRH
jgi:hypothetical protein